MKAFFTIICILTAAYGGYLIGLHSETDIPCTMDQPALREHMDND